MSKNTELVRVARIVLDEVFVPGAEHKLKNRQVVTHDGEGNIIHKSIASYNVEGLSATTNTRTRVNFVQLSGAIKVVREPNIFNNERFTLIIPAGTTAEAIVTMIAAFKEFTDGAKPFDPRVSDNAVSMKYGKSLNV